MKRRCLDCDVLTDQSRCPTHTKAKDRARGTRQQRGYNTAHDKARAALVATLPHPCAYGCGRTLTQPQDLVAAHVLDGDPTQGWQPACALCNQRAKTRTP